MTVVTDARSRRRTLVWKGLSLALAGCLIGVVIVGLALGGCHSAGGFCSGEFDQANRDAFYSALAASLPIGPLLIAVFSRKTSHLVIAAAIGFAITCGLVVSLWP